MVRKSVSLDELNKISKIDIKNPKKYFKELEEFSKPEKITIKNSDEEIIINLVEGDAKKGLTHIWLRHVIGYESDKTATTFFPMGQTVNGKKLPKIIDDDNELKKIIKKAAEENKDNIKGSNPKIKYMYEKDGKIIEITLKFQKDKKTGAYKLMTIYPESGDNIYKYVPKKPDNRWKTWKRNKNGELIGIWEN